MKSDKMLFWMIMIIAVLAISAVIVFVLREEPQYIDENTPEAVVHNLVLAIYKEDIEKAYQYVYPDIEYDEFLELSNFENNYSMGFGIMVTGSKMIDDENARVEILVSSGSGDIVRGSYQYTETAIVKIDADDGNWKVQQLFPYLYMFDRIENKAVPVP